MGKEDDNLFHYLANLVAEGVDPREREDEIWERFGETVSILVLDSSGFSRVSKSHGIVHFLAQLMQMREATHLLFQQSGCRHFRFEADNVIAVFDHPDQAIRCALDIHATLHNQGLMLTEDERFKVCIGIGFGRMLYSKTLEGFFADEMNFASKLGEDTADGGETLLTSSAYAAADARLLTGFKQRVVNVSGVEITYYRNQFMD